MPTRKISGPPPARCPNPEHQPPSMMVYEPGTYEHTCPGCGNKIVFTVAGVSYGVRVGSRRQEDTGHWVERTFGPEVLYSMPERGRRNFEESVELNQALNLPKEQLHTIVDHVYSRPVGDVEQEIAGVGVTLYALGYAYGVSVDDAVDKEIDRIHKLPGDYFRKKHQAKQTAGIALVPSSVIA